MATMPEDWVDFSREAGEPWTESLQLLPADWTRRDGEGLQLPRWLARIIEAWGRESFAHADPKQITRAVERLGPEAASMLLVKLAHQFDRTEAEPRTA